MKTVFRLSAALFALVLMASVSMAEETKAQTICPVMGGAVNKSLYVDQDGKRIYLCCAYCKAQVKENFDKYAKKLEDQGVVLAQVPAPEAKEAPENKEAPEAKADKPAVCAIDGKCEMPKAEKKRCAACKAHRAHKHADTKCEACKAGKAHMHGDKKVEACPKCTAMKGHKKHHATPEAKKAGCCGGCGGHATKTTKVNSALMETPKK